MTDITTPHATTPQPPGWSNADPHDGITSTEPPPEHVDMTDPGWSNGDGSDVVLPPPTVTTLTPATAVLGSPSFTLHVHGTGFVDGSVITVAGLDEPTTLVSATEVTTGIDMAVWVGPDPAVPVAVRNPDGAISSTLPFAFTDAGRA